MYINNVDSVNTNEGQSSERRGHQSPWNIDISKQERENIGSVKKGIKRGKIKRKEKKILEADEEEEEGADFPPSDSLSLCDNHDALRIAYDKQNDDITKKLSKKISVSEGTDTERVRGLQVYLYIYVNMCYIIYIYIYLYIYIYIHIYIYIYIHI
jgi:hypothetical protein